MFEGLIKLAEVDGKGGAKTFYVKDPYIARHMYMKERRAIPGNSLLNMAPILGAIGGGFAGAAGGVGLEKLLKNKVQFADGFLPLSGGLGLGLSGLMGAAYLAEKFRRKKLLERGVYATKSRPGLLMREDAVQKYRDRNKYLAEADIMNAKKMGMK